MAVKHKNLFLYLTLACFVGLILIFIFDGYMGIYDSLFITTGEQEDQIKPDQWPQRDRYWPTSVERDQKAFFRYEVENRWFSSYSADIEVSVWREQEKVSDLLAQPISVASFDKGQLEWVLDATEFVPADIPPEQDYEFTMLIKRADIERRIIIHVRSVLYPSKVVIPEPPR